MAEIIPFEPVRIMPEKGVARIDIPFGDKMENFGLYMIITNPQAEYTKIAELCVKHDIKMLQLREKDKSDRDIFTISREIMQVVKGTDTNFVINDRPDIAKLVNSDFLHLGQDDLPLSEAEKVYSGKIGLSTHSLAQMDEAVKQNPAYIGFGPLYRTPTKKKPDPAVGLEHIPYVVERAGIPVVFLGGIFPENVDLILKAGAKNISLVRYFMETSEIEDRMKRIIEKIEKYK